MMDNEADLTGEQRKYLRMAFGFDPDNPPSAETVTIRQAAGGFAAVLMFSCPDGRELWQAMLKIEEALLWAESAVINSERNSRDD